MQHTEGKFNASDGLELYYQAWLPAPKEHGEPKAVLAVVHGYGEHSGRYLNPVSYFVPRGLALYAYDLRGHGQSPGPRGHINRFDEFLSDTDAFLKLVRRFHPGLKLFLLGHSLGGLIVSAYVENYPASDLSGLIMSSAFLGFKMQVPAFKAAVGRVMSGLMPAMTMKNDLSAALLSHDPAVAAAYDTDPLNHHGATARFFTEVAAAQARALERAGEVRLPLTVMYAGDDQIADPECSRVFFERAASADRTTRRYDGYYHEIFNETGKEVVFKDLESWLAGRV
jgi:alpha-beta hydrolase superfamily lysophospholipase